MGGLVGKQGWGRDPGGRGRKELTTRLGFLPGANRWCLC